LPDLKPEAVGPYIALIAYARAAGASTHDHAKAIVDDLITIYPTMSLPELMPVIDLRANPAGHHR